MINNFRYFLIIDLNIQNYLYNNLFDLIYQLLILIIKKIYNFFIYLIFNCFVLVYEMYVMLMLLKLIKKKIYGIINLTVLNYG